MNHFTTPLDTAIAYTAGIVDGEGSIGKSHKSLTPTVTVVQSAPNRGEQLCEWLHSTWGFGSYRFSVYDTQLKDNLEMWTWVVAARRESLWLLECIYPYLIVKQEQAELAISILCDNIDDCQRWMRWSAREDWFIRNNSESLSSHAIADALNRSPAAIRQRAQALHVRLTHGGHPYSASEDAYIHTHYGKVRTQHIADHLSRSRPSINSRAYSLGLVSSVSQTGKYIPESRIGMWTSSDDEYLSTNYPTGDYEQMSSHLGRTVAAIKIRANRLKLRRLTRVDWKHSELDFLRANYSSMTTRQLATKLDRSMGSISGMAFRLGIRKSN